MSDARAVRPCPGDMEANPPEEGGESRSSMRPAHTVCSPSSAAKWHKHHLRAQKVLPGSQLCSDRPGRLIPARRASTLLQCQQAEAQEASRLRAHRQHPRGSGGLGAADPTSTGLWTTARNVLLAAVGSALSPTDLGSRQAWGPPGHREVLLWGTVLLLKG